MTDSQATEAMVKIHDCCGCSCYICKVKHDIGPHTPACTKKFWEEVNGINRP